jgi:uncharacterized protein YodC (DUF2158 family)
MSTTANAMRDGPPGALGSPHSFRSGDRAWLKSGSPPLTVLDVGRETGLIWCRWMSDAGAVMEGTFTPQALKADHSSAGEQAPASMPASEKSAGTVAPPNPATVEGPAEDRRLQEAIARTTWTDTDLLVALMALLIGLAEKLTGEKVTLFVRNAHGLAMPMGPDPRNVRFERCRDDVDSSDRPPGHPPTRGADARPLPSTP